MQRAQEGDADAYRRLLEETRAVVEVYLRRFLGDSPLVEDCVQESLLGVHKARHAYEPGRSFRPWLFAIVRHKALDALRSQARSARRERAAPAPQPASAAPEARVDAKRFLAGLEPKYRDALVLTKLEGRSIREAAGMLGISETALKSRVSRGIRMARRLIEREPLG